MIINSFKFKRKINLKNFNYKWKSLIVNWIISQNQNIDTIHFFFFRFASNFQIFSISFFHYDFWRSCACCIYWKNKINSSKKKNSMSILFKIFQNQTYKSSASTFDQMRRLFRSHEKIFFDKCYNAFNKYNYNIYITNVFVDIILYSV